MNDTLTKQQTVARQIADLSQMSMAELWSLWDRYFKTRPQYPNRTNVESRIAYKLQEEAFGGLATETRQRLEAIGAKHSKIKLRASKRGHARSVETKIRSRTDALLRGLLYTPSGERMYPT